jgi:rubredoxin
MGERALRGTRLGATSYENDRNTDLAPRKEVAYNCPKGHKFVVPLAAEAEVPATWECRNCGSMALQVNARQPEQKKTKPPRTHWDMLLERRTIKELEEVLNERLAILRAQQRMTVPGR